MFENSLIDLDVRPQSRRRWLSLPLAVGLHLAGLGAFALGSYWNVGQVPDPQIADVFMLTLPPPLSGGGQKQPPRQPEHKAQTPAPKRTVQPDLKQMPDKPPAPADERTEVDDPAPVGPATKDSTGPTGPGGPGGPGDGPGPVGPGGPSEEPGDGDSQPIRLSFGMTRPELIHQVQPRYTEIARRAAIQGTVIVEAVIDEEGRVTNVRLIRGLPMGLDREALEAIQQWRFKPAMSGGRAVKVYYTLTVNFSIQR
jgi:protein TonB